MSGPPYPRAPLGGIGSPIGGFIIGVSAIGVPKSFDVWETVISQYANSPSLTGIITSFDEAMDLSDYFETFYDNVWNVDTAVGRGLDVWGRIVDVSRVLHVPGSIPYFGFEEAAAYTFGEASFFSSAPATNNVVLSDSAYRTLIYAKALANITDGSIPAINQILLTLFPGRGNAYVIDDLDMTMVYRFEFALSAVEIAIVTQSGVLPRSTGVQASTSIGP